MDFNDFYAGKEFEAYRFLGAHIDGEGAVFRTFAPAASAVAWIGERSGWQEIPMRRIYDGNFWECRVEGAAAGQMYKYRVYRRDGSFCDHCDPYGFYAQVRPDTASVAYRLDGFSFTDGAWMSERGMRKEGPINIYEIHAGSWRQKGADGDIRARWLSYRELAEAIVPYLKESHYNYLELMPLAEHPSDESWGYQNTGFFSPTSRYGEPDGLRYLVNLCHENGIGVIMDFVPVHFAVDDYGLARFDGTCLYEYPHTDVGRSEWGSCNFMHSRGEVRSFLQSAAFYWLREFHFDGLRMDAVSNLIYWQGDASRGVNHDAVRFLQGMNEGLKERIPDALLIAEDSTDYPGVTRPVRDGGLGFDYKWDLGWMNDTLSFFQSAPEQRVENYHRLTFSMLYFYKEKYLLPLSHDEVVHGKAAILQKMNGGYERKFPQARALYLYMTAHPGKKLNFCGNEIGQLREWDEKRQQDWELLRYPAHDGFYHYMKELNRVYLETPALFMEDYAPEGFRWLDCHQELLSVYAFERRAGAQRVIAVFNFSEQVRENYYLPVDGSDDYYLPVDGPDGDGDTEFAAAGDRMAESDAAAGNGQAEFAVLIDSDDVRYGGSGLYGKQTFRPRDGMVRMTLPPFSGILLQW